MINPFDEGVSYVQFLEDVEKSKKTVEKYCENIITKEQIDWLLKDLEIFKKDIKYGN